MRLLFLGDVVAQPGRRVIQHFVPSLIKEESIHFVIANGENAAGGLGIDQKSAEELYQGKVDLITGGNHSWDKKEVHELYERDHRILRPANFPNNPKAKVPGRGHYILTKSEFPNLRLGVLNLMGRVHMDPLDDPFAVADHYIDWFRKEGVNSILVDLHAEATSEKQAFAHFVCGRVSAVVGSHTHVQTADERILVASNGAKTAYITDAGMNGPYDSVIGMKKEKSIQKFLTKIPQKYEPAEGLPGLHGVVIDIDDNTGHAVSIKRVSKFI